MRHWTLTGLGEGITFRTVYSKTMAPQRTQFRGLNWRTDFMSDDHPKADLEDLENRLKRARDEGKSGQVSSGLGGKGENSGFGMAMRIGTEMVSALILGVVIGLALDNWLDTGPWFLLVFFFLGAGAGILNVYRAANRLGMAPGYRQEDNETSGEISPGNKMDKL